MTWEVTFTCFGPDDNGRVTKLSQNKTTFDGTFEEMKSEVNRWGKKTEGAIWVMDDEFDKIDEFYEDRISLCYTTDSMFMLCCDAVKQVEV